MIRQRLDLLIAMTFFFLFTMPEISSGMVNNYLSIVLQETLNPALQQSEIPICVEHQQFFAANRLFKRLIYLHPITNHTILLHTRYAWTQGKCATAEELLQSAIAMDPYWGSVVAASIWIVNKEKVPVELQDDLSQYAQSRGQLADSKGDFESAIQWDEISLHLAPNKDAATQLSGIYARTGDSASILATWELFKEQLTPDDADYWWAEAQIAELQKDWLQAIAAYKQFVPMSSDQYSVLMRLGEIYAQVKDYENAADAYTKAIQERPTVMMPYLALGHLALGEGDYKTALFWYKQAEIVEPNADEPKFFQGRVYCESDYFSQAEAFFEAARIADFDDPSLYFYWALCLDKQGDAMRAVDTMKQAIDFSVEVGTQPVAWMVMLGDWLKDQGETEKAKIAYQQALAWQPESSFIQQRIQSVQK